MEELGVPGGAVEQIFGSHLTVALLIQRRQRCIVYPIPTRADRCTASAFPWYVVTASHPNTDRGNATAGLSVRRFLTVRTCPPTPIEKFCHSAALIPPRLRSSLHRVPPHGGNLMEEDWGSLAGRSNRFLGPT